LRIRVPRKTALLITFLSSVGKANPKEIERGADLRQPDVSTMMRLLRANNWINEREIKMKGKGRPIQWQRYCLTSTA